MSKFKQDMQQLFENLMAGENLFKTKDVVHDPNIVGEVGNLPPQSVGVKQNQTGIDLGQ